MVVKNIQDYYDKICELYPSISKSDIKKILQFGFKSLYLHNSYGGDTLIQNKNFWFYCGSLMKDSIKWFNYYINKTIVKLRVNYRRNKTEWDGYYYFALSEKQYNEYLKQKHKKGRPRKWFTFNNIILYKIFDECNLSEHSKVAIFRLPCLYEQGFVVYKEELKTNKLEFIQYRNPLKFSDLLKSNYNNYGKESNN